MDGKALRELDDVADKNNPEEARQEEQHAVSVGDLENHSSIESDQQFLYLHFFN